MRSYAYSLLSRLARLKPSKRSYAERHGISSCSSSYPNNSYISNYAKTKVLMCNFRHFQTIPYSEPETQNQTNSRVSSRQRSILEKAKLDEAFEAAKTLQDMLRLFGKMEACFDEKELGMASLKVGLKLDQEGEDPEKALQFGIRAVRALDNDDGKPSLPIAMALQLAGSASYSLNRFRDALGYVNKAKRVLASLELDKDVSGDDIRPIMHAVLHVLASSKMAMGRREEALEDFKKCLELKELILGSDSKEFGIANREMAEAYVSVLNFKEALQFGLKALEIHTSALGNNSVEVAHDRRVLGIIYSGLEHHENALEQNQLSQKVLKKWGLKKDLVQAEIDASNIKIALGKFEEAITTLKEIVHLTSQDSETRAIIFISMAKALSHQGKSDESKKCLEVACGILNKKENVSPVEVAEAYSEIATQFESMGAYETSIAILKKSLRLLESAHIEQASEAKVSGRVGWLLLMTGKVSEAIPHLENAADRLKESFGPNHYGVGYIYNNLGAAYMELERPESAAQMFALSKEVMDVALGPHHIDTIEASQNLAKSHAVMKNYGTAIDFQKEAISGWESQGPDAAAQLKEARRVLEELIAQATAAQVNQLVEQTLADVGLSGNNTQTERSSNQSE